MELTGWRLVLNVALAAMTRLSRHHVSGSGGCNRLMGSYEAKGAQLTFSQMATTRMACAQGMDTEKAARGSSRDGGGVEDHGPTT